MSFEKFESGQVYHCFHEGQIMPVVSVLPSLQVNFNKDAWEKYFDPSMRFVELFYDKTSMEVGLKQYAVKEDGMFSLNLSCNKHSAVVHLRTLFKKLNILPKSALYFMVEKDAEGYIKFNLNKPIRKVKSRTYKAYKSGNRNYSLKAKDQV